MLERARERPDQVDWHQGDLNAWSPATPPDLIYSNAALHLVDGHASLFPRLAEVLAPGGVLAVQMPQVANDGFRSAVFDVAEHHLWAARLGERRRLLTLPLNTYHALLSPLCAVDAWSTTYLHALTGERPVLEWIKGAHLRRYLAALADDTERNAFLDAVAERLHALYPPGPDGVTLFPFTRLFIVARRR